MISLLISLITYIVTIRLGGNEVDQCMNFLDFINREGPNLLIQEKIETEQFNLLISHSKILKSENIFISKLKTNFTFNCDIQNTNTIGLSLDSVMDTRLTGTTIGIDNGSEMVNAIGTPATNVKSIYDEYTDDFINKILSVSNPLSFIRFIKIIQSVYSLKCVAHSHYSFLMILRTLNCPMDIVDIINVKIQNLTKIYRENLSTFVHNAENSVYLTDEESALLKSDSLANNYLLHNETPGLPWGELQAEFWTIANFELIKLSMGFSNDLSMFGKAFYKNKLISSILYLAELDIFLLNLKSTELVKKESFGKYFLRRLSLFGIIPIAKGGYKSGFSILPILSIPDDRIHHRNILYFGVNLWLKYSIDSSISTLSTVREIRTSSEFVRSDFIERYSEPLSFYIDYYRNFKITFKSSSETNEYRMANLSKRLTRDFTNLFSTWQIIEKDWPIGNVQPSPIVGYNGIECSGEINSLKYYVNLTQYFVLREENDQLVNCLHFTPFIFNKVSVMVNLVRSNVWPLTVSRKQFNESYKSYIPRFLKKYGNGLKNQKNMDYILPYVDQSLTCLKPLVKPANFMEEASYKSIEKLEVKEKCSN